MRAPFHIRQRGAPCGPLSILPAPCPRCPHGALFPCPRRAPPERARRCPLPRCPPARRAPPCPLPAPPRGPIRPPIRAPAPLPDLISGKVSRNARKGP
jgi:hypothetical protein